MAQKKENKIKNTLKRYEEDVDKKTGVIMMNDFLQLSGILEELSKSNVNAFYTMFCLVEEKLRLEEENKKRGKIIAKLQKKKK